MSGLAYESLREAQNEIARHHRDFERIRAVLDQADADNGIALYDALNYLRRIRNVVG